MQKCNRENTKLAKKAWMEKGEKRRKKCSGLSKKD